MTDGVEDGRARLGLSISSSLRERAVGEEGGVEVRDTGSEVSMSMLLGRGWVGVGKRRGKGGEDRDRESVEPKVLACVCYVEMYV